MWVLFFFGTFRFTSETAGGSNSTSKSKSLFAAARPSAQEPKMRTDRSG